MVGSAAGGVGVGDTILDNQAGSWCRAAARKGNPLALKKRLSRGI